MQKYIYVPFALGKRVCVLGNDCSGNDNAAVFVGCSVSPEMKYTALLSLDSSKSSIIQV